MAGLQKVLKMYGKMTGVDAKGNKVVWVWDYFKDEPRLETEMTKDEWAASEKAKWGNIKDQIQQLKENSK